jgi:hypothetical protein
MERKGERPLEDCHYTTKTREPSPKPEHGGVGYNSRVTQIVDYPWPSISLPFLLKRPRLIVFQKLFYIKTNLVSFSSNLNKGQICDICQMLAEHS